MKSLSILAGVCSCLLAVQLKAQHSGNIVYGQNHNASTVSMAHGNSKCFLTDSTFLIEGSVLLNVPADEYVATFGVTEEASVLKDCNDKINKRVSDFMTDLSKMGIAKADMFVDVTTQNKIYDYHKNPGMLEQYLKGFELKKNVIVRFKKIGDLDNMIVAASNYQIYDLVKVDYVVTDVQKIYVQLFQAAMEVINQKKGLYVSATNVKIQPASSVYSEQFYSYYPSQMYKTYTAYETGEVYDTYGSGNVKKDLRKSATVYYDKTDYSGFDKVINPAVVEPGVEFVLSLRIEYQKEKARSK